MKHIYKLMLILGIISSAHGMEMEEGSASNDSKAAPIKFKKNMLHKWEDSRGSNNSNPKCKKSKRKGVPCRILPSDPPDNKKLKISREDLDVLDVQAQATAFSGQLPEQERELRKDVSQTKVKEIWEYYLENKLPLKEALEILKVSIPIFKQPYSRDREGFLITNTPTAQGIERDDNLQKRRLRKDISETEFKDVYNSYLERKLNLKDASNLLKISSPTFYRLQRDFGLPLKQPYSMDEGGSLPSAALPAQGIERDEGPVQSSNLSLLGFELQDLDEPLDLRVKRPNPQRDEERGGFPYRAALIPIGAGVYKGLKLHRIWTR